MRYPNLRAEIARSAIKLSDIAKVLGVTTTNASKAVRGARKIDIREAIRIRDTFFPGVSLDYLYAYTADEGKSA